MITFDFLADRSAADFRKTGHNAALAAKGAKVLSNVIETRWEQAAPPVGAVAKALTLALLNTHAAAKALVACC